MTCPPGLRLRHVCARERARRLSRRLAAGGKPRDSWGGALPRETSTPYIRRWRSSPTALLTSSISCRSLISCAYGGDVAVAEGGVNEFGQLKSTGELHV